MFIEIANKLIQLNLVRNFERSGEFSITVNYTDGTKDEIIFATEQKRNHAYNKLGKELIPKSVLMEVK
jgi:uncharacterized protein YkuJ